MKGNHAFAKGVHVGEEHMKNSRVGKNISVQAAPRTVRESLPSYGSYYSVMLLFQVSSDKTAVDSRIGRQGALGN